MVKQLRRPCLNPEKSCCCDRCHWIFKCGDETGCCWCLPRRLCVTLTHNFGCTETCSCDSRTTVLTLDCEFQKYYGNIICGDIVVDFELDLEIIEGVCFARVRSACLGWTNGYEQLIEMFVPEIGQCDDPDGPKCKTLNARIENIDLSQCGDLDCLSGGTIEFGQPDELLNAHCCGGCAGIDCICSCFCVTFKEDLDSEGCTDLLQYKTVCYDEYTRSWTASFFDRFGIEYDFTFTIEDDGYGFCEVKVVSEVGGVVASGRTASSTDLEFQFEFAGYGDYTIRVSIKCNNCGERCETDDPSCQNCCGAFGTPYCTNLPDLVATLISDSCLSGGQEITLVNSAACPTTQCQTWCNLSSFELDCPGSSQGFIQLSLLCGSNPCDGSNAYSYRLLADISTTGNCKFTTGGSTVELFPTVAMCDPFLMEFELPGIVSSSPIATPPCDCCDYGLRVRITE